MRKPQYERQAFLIHNVKSIFWRVRKASKQRIYFFAELALCIRDSENSLPVRLT
jgi:hypothetical protein